MSLPADPARETDLEEFVRLPALFQRWEIKPSLLTSPHFRIEPAGYAPDGRPLFAVLVRQLDAQRRPHAVTDAEPTAAELPRRRRALGELQARHRDEHLCFRCTHQGVCRLTATTSLIPALMVTVSGCSAFASPDTDESCELMPIEPVPLQ